MYKPETIQHLLRPCQRVMLRLAILIIAIDNVYALDTLNTHAQVKTSLIYIGNLPTSQRHIILNNYCIFTNRGLLVLDDLLVNVYTTCGLGYRVVPILDQEGWKNLR